MSKKFLLFLFVIILCSGCSANYSLDISDEGLKEKITIKASTAEENDKLINYPETAYYDSEDNNVDPMKKLSGVEYYKDSLEKEDGLKKITYEYLFTSNNFTKSNAASGAYDTIILRKYDHDDDGKEDYTLLTTDDNFKYFDNNNIDSITIAITCHYKIISHNADSRNGNTLIWNFTKERNKAINLVYDDRVLLDKKKLLSNSTLSFFVIIIPIIIFIFMLYWSFNKYSNKKNRIPK